MVRKLKNHFARHGSLCQLVSDNGPQFVAAEFQKLTKEWDIEHRVTSPYNSKANSKVEAAVKSAKKLLCKTAKGGNDYWLSAIRSNKRSYEVQTADGSSYRRNRAHLKKTYDSRPEATQW